MPIRFNELLDETAPAIVPPPPPNALAPPPSWIDVAEGAEALRRIVDAGVAGYRNTPPILTPEAREAVNRGGPVGRYITNPVLDVLGVGVGMLGGFGAATGAAIAEGGGAVGGPALGRDLNMALQVAMPERPVPRGTVGGAVADVRRTATELLTDERGSVPGIGHNSFPGIEDRVSTRIPFAKDSPDAHQNADFRIDRQAMRDAPDAYEKNATELAKYPDFPKGSFLSSDAALDSFQRHMQDNLVHIIDGVRAKHGQSVIDRSQLWYDGAHDIAARWAKENGYQPRQVAGMLANLSPQKDWFQNVDLGRRILEIKGNEGESRFSPDMNRWVEKYLAEQRADPKVTEGKLKGLAGLEAEAKRLQGKPLADMDAGEKAIFIRAFDEANNSRFFPVVEPEGKIPGDLVLTEQGKPRKIGWGSFTEIEKAIQALESGDLSTLSQTLGKNHKVRNFFNNIISPNNPFGDITIDTHAIAAAHLMALGGTHPIVQRGLGMAGSKAASTGSMGAYGFYADMYRELAQQLGLQPRQLQSITWEGVRGLFSDKQKRDKSFVNQNMSYWAPGGDPAKIRRLITEHAGDFNAPAWHRGGGE